MTKLTSLIFTIIIIALVSCSIPRRSLQYNPYKRGGKSIVEPDAELGTKENPVRCFNPEGEREYLKRLRTKNGESFNFEREGSFGLGGFGNVVDLYKIWNADSTQVFEVFMDMYFVDYIEYRPVFGLNISKPYSYYKTEVNTFRDSIDFADLRESYVNSGEFEPYIDIPEIDQLYELVDKEKYQKAIDLSKKLVRKYPEQIDLYHVPSLCYYELRDSLNWSRFDKIEWEIVSLIKKKGDGSSIDKPITPISQYEISVMMSIYSAKYLSSDFINRDRNYYEIITYYNLDSLKTDTLFCDVTKWYKKENVFYEGVNLRPAFPLTIRTKKDSISFIMEESPYITQNELMLHISETLFIKTKIDSNSIRMQEISTSRQNESDIEINVYQMKDDVTTIMVVKNPFEQSIIYDCSIIPLNGELTTTSTVPVFGGIQSSEMWPYPIYRIFVGNFRFVE